MIPFEFVCAGIFGGLLAPVHLFAPLPSGWTVLALFGLASIALFRHGWQKVPRSFSIAPLDVTAAVRTEADGDPKLRLAPVFRSIYMS